jgi:hypothetical protein
MEVMFFRNVCNHLHDHTVLQQKNQNGQIIKLHMKGDLLWSGKLGNSADYRVGCDCGTCVSRNVLFEVEERQCQNVGAVF